MISHDDYEYLCQMILSDPVAVDLDPELACGCAAFLAQNADPDAADPEA